MSVDLKKLANINKEIKYAVYGYIREHKPLFASKEYNIFNNIPDLIPSVCILYADHHERFESIGDNVVYVNEDKTAIKKQKPGKNPVEHCYGSVVVSGKSNYICKWELKMLNMSRLKGTCITVGIASTKLTDTTGSSYKSGDEFYVHSNYGWARDHIQMRYRTNGQQLGKYYQGCDCCYIGYDF